MARTLQDASLATGEARRRLSARGKPYYRLIEPGLHLGYRKPVSGTGKWVVRQYTGAQSYLVKTIAAADDNSDADGIAILDFGQAQKLARQRMVSAAHTAAGKGRPLTVNDVMLDYLDFLEAKRKSAQGARYVYEAFIKDTLGNIEVNALTSDMIHAWHVALAKRPARKRTPRGKPQRYIDTGRDDEAVRRRRSSANRMLTTLKAALNRAWKYKRKLVPSDDEWRAIERFESVDAARSSYLQLAEAKRLINACDGDFKVLVKAALETGARYGELGRFKVRDFNEDIGAIAVPVSKTGKSRHVVLTADGVAFFQRVCLGRSGGELMLTRNGKPWGVNAQGRPIKEACERAKIKPAINFHALRHTWASLSAMAGVPLLVVARNLGHTDTKMVEKHYGHLAPSYVADAIREHAPKFGRLKETNLRAMR
jgi:integrase